jgi:hypothetical protein
MAGSSGKAVAASKGLSVLETKSILSRPISFALTAAPRRREPESNATRWILSNPAETQ